MTVAIISTTQIEYNLSDKAIASVNDLFFCFSFVVRIHPVTPYLYKFYRYSTVKHICCQAYKMFIANSIN